MLVIYSNFSVFFPVGIITEEGVPNPIFLYLDTRSDALYFHILAMQAIIFTYIWMDPDNIPVTVRINGSNLSLFISLLAHGVSIGSTMTRVDGIPYARLASGFYLHLLITVAMLTNAYFLMLWQRDLLLERFDLPIVVHRNGKLRNG